MRAYAIVIDYLSDAAQALYAKYGLAIKQGHLRRKNCFVKY